MPTWEVDARRESRARVAASSSPCACASACSAATTPTSAPRSAARCACQAQQSLGLITYSNNACRILDIKDGIACTLRHATL